jgi:hypothetical protein
MSRQTLLIRLAETEHRISAAEARIAVLTDMIVKVSGETLWRAAAELRSANDALDVMRQYRSTLLEQLAQDDAE